MFSGILRNFILILDNFKKMLFYILFLNYLVLYLYMPLKERVFLTHKKKFNMFIVSDFKNSKNYFFTSKTEAIKKFYCVFEKIVFSPILGDCDIIFSQQTNSIKAIDKFCEEDGVIELICELWCYKENIDLTEIFDITRLH